MQEQYTPTKTCIRCEMTLPVDAFNKCSANLDGLQRYCRECQRTVKSQWNKEHREHQVAYNNAYYHAHPEKGRETRARWAKNNPMRVREVKKRHKLQDVGIVVERVDYQAILDTHGMTCHVCGEPIISESDLH